MTRPIHIDLQCSPRLCQSFLFIFSFLGLIVLQFFQTFYGKARKKMQWVLRELK